MAAREESGEEDYSFYFTQSSDQVYCVMLQGGREGVLRSGELFPKSLIRLCVCE